ncbi:MAG: hypothetical protein ABEL76_07970 [Bradymonadaceae bacterium]
MTDAPDTRPSVAVLGSDLAATVALARLREADVETVALRSTSRDLSALWGGLGWVWGPVSERPTSSAGCIGPTDAAEPNVRRERSDRWERLLERRPYHPYRRLGLDLDAVDELTESGADDLGEASLVRDVEHTLPGPYGEPAFPDLVAESARALVLQADDELGVVACPALDDWRASRVAERVGRAESITARVVELAPFDEVAGGHAVRVATRLTEQLPDGGESLANRAADLVEEHGLDIVGLPPCLGASPDEHARLSDGLDAALDIRWGEWPAARHPVHGWRLDRSRRDRDHDAADHWIETDDWSLIADGDSITAVETGTDKPCEVDAVILATGGWLEGGLPASAPLCEPATGAPLWLDGQPISNPDEQFVPNLLDDRPWDDHALFRAGIGIDDQCRPLGPDGEAVHDNAFAAGRGLAGFNRIHDDCTMGVQLVSGRVAADCAFDQMRVKE